MKKLLFCALICASVMVSCNKSDNPGDFYTGEVGIVNGAVKFYDNATRRIFSIGSGAVSPEEMKNKYDAVEKADTVRSAFASFRGELKVDGNDTLMYIKSLEYMGNDYQYGDQMYFATTYRYPEDMELLELKKDYTFSLMQADKSNPVKGKTIAKGKWGLLSPDKIVMRTNWGKETIYTVMPAAFNSLYWSDGKSKKLYSPTFEDHFPDSPASED